MANKKLSSTCREPENLTPAQRRLLECIGRGENIWQGRSKTNTEPILQALIFGGYVYLQDLETEGYALSWKGKRTLRGLQNA